MPAKLWKCKQRLSANSRGKSQYPAPTRALLLLKASRRQACRPTCVSASICDLWRCQLLPSLHRRARTQGQGTDPQQPLPSRTGASYTRMPCLSAPLRLNYAQP
jgi:hypothetical protein